MTVPRIYIDSSSLKVSPTGVDVTTASDGILLLSDSQRNLQLVANGTYYFPDQNFPSDTVSTGTLTLSYPDYGAIPCFILLPIFITKTWSSGVFVGQYYTWPDGKWQDSVLFPSSTHVTTLNNTTAVASCSGPAVTSSIDANVSREGCGGFIYYILRKEETS